MYSSILIGAALGLFAMQVLMRRIPESLGTLWNRNIIVAKPTTVSGEAIPTAEAPNLNANPSKPVPLEEQYQAFIHNLEELLNSPGQWAMGVVFGLLAISWRFIYAAEHGPIVFRRIFFRLRNS